MYLYHLTLQPPTHIPTAVSGSFSGENRQELVALRGTSRIQLLSLSPDTGKLTSLGLCHLFCTVRSLAAFRLPGATQDYLVLGTDAGRMVLLWWRDGAWERVHRETLGRSGVRRTVAGEYVACDPRGRAIMTAAVEKQKLVYAMNRDPADGRLTISSPLEAGKPNVVVFSLVGVDSGYENPLFAVLEVDTTPAVNGEIDDASKLEKQLVFYELELGLNHVMRKSAEVVDRSSHLLFAVPGGDDGPGGVLVFSAGRVEWRRMGHAAVYAHIPRRKNCIDTVAKRDLLIVSAAVVRAKGGLFFLCQSEEGDLFRVSLVLAEERVAGISVSYYDTVPVGIGIFVFRSGFLFVASEWAPLGLYQIQALGGDAPFSEEFTPRELTNLVLVDQLESYSELTDGRVMNLGEEETPQIYALQGRAETSTFNVMRLGLHVTEIATSELPAEATGIWTLKQGAEDAEDAYIVVSFADSTVVLRIGETVEEESETGLLNSVRSINVGQLFDGSFVQVHEGGVRQVRPDRRINEWKAPSPVSVAAINSRQVVVALANRSIVYFEVDSIGILLERKSLADLPDPIASIALGPVPMERQRSRFLAVGSDDMTVRILSCDPEECLEPLSLQALASRAVSLLITGSASGILDGDDESGGGLTLDVGLENGVLARLKLDHNTGALTDARTRYLGALPVRLAVVKSEAAGDDAILAMSSRPWMGFTHQRQAHLSPLSYLALSSAAPFASAQCPAGFVAIGEASLRILMVESVEERFTKTQVPLENTPRRMAHHPTTNLFAVIESDHRGYSGEEREAIECCYHRQSTGGPASAVLGEDEMAKPQLLRLHHLSFAGRWSSCLRLLRGDHSYVHRFSANEALTCVCFVTFYDRLNELYVAVGVAQDMAIAPRKADACKILLFLVDAASGQLTLTHVTPTDDIPSCVTAFGGRLLAGVGSTLRLYDIGKKQLLRKCEIRLPHFATTIQTQGWRVFVGDSQSSLLLFQYHHGDNRFQLIADDTMQKPVTAALCLDYDTVMIADRLGTLSVLRLPANVSEDLENETTVGAVTAKRERLFGAPFKLERLAEFHLGDTITMLSKTTLSLGSRELVLYGTIEGAVGILMPFTSREETLTLQNLELALRMESPATLAGREHLSYRSYYAPVKSVIDGDLIETFVALSGDRKYFVAQTVDRSPSDLLRKIRDLRVTAGV